MTLEEAPVSYEELMLIELEFDDVDTEILRKQYALSAPLYEKRAATIGRIPSFWPLVFEQSPPDFDCLVQPTDSVLFAEALTNVSVTRFELDADPQNGSPRSVAITLTFKENPYFEDETLEKKFWYRRAKDGWVGLVSEPVKIHWKKGKDMTDGITDAAIKRWKAKQKYLAQANGNADSRKAQALPEEKVLKAKVEKSDEGSLSFWNWFAFVSARRWVSAEESEQATKEHQARREKRQKGEKVEDEPELDDLENIDEEPEVFPAGEELANVISEDIWPNAIKYFTSAMGEDEVMSQESFEGEDMEDDEESGDEVDIRALVGQGKGKRKSADDDRPSKSRKT